MKSTYILNNLKLKLYVVTMYKEQIDQQQVYDIYSGRKEMTLEDRMLQKWMMHVPIQTTEEDINKRIHVNEGLRTNVKKMRMV